MKACEHCGAAEAQVRLVEVKNFITKKTYFACVDVGACARRRGIKIGNRRA